MLLGDKKKSHRAHYGIFFIAVTCCFVSLWPFIKQTDGRFQTLAEYLKEAQTSNSTHHHKMLYIYYPTSNRQAVFQLQGLPLIFLDRPTLLDLSMFTSVSMISALSDDRNIFKNIHDTIDIKEYAGHTVSRFRLADFSLLKSIREKSTINPVEMALYPTEQTPLCCHQDEDCQCIKCDTLKGYAYPSVIDKPQIYFECLQLDTTEGHIALQWQFQQTHVFKKLQISYYQKNPLSQPYFVSLNTQKSKHGKTKDNLIEHVAQQPEHFYQQEVLLTQSIDYLSFKTNANNLCLNIEIN